MMDSKKLHESDTITKISTHNMGWFIGNNIQTGPVFIGEEMKGYKRKTFTSHSMT